MLPSRRISGITDVAERQLCTGCGVCASVQPDVIRMVDDIEFGRRPIVAESDAAGQRPTTTAALACCPGAALRHDDDPAGIDVRLRAAWGPVLEVWEGFAADPEIRWKGSSGGAATAIALHCLTAEGMHGVLHIRARDDVPYLNETVLSTTRDELVSATGSRYAPASPCDRLDLVRAAPAPCVFIGKPCDVAAVAQASRHDAELGRQVGLTIAIFCAGTPTTRGTLEMMRAMGIEDPATVTSVRYRGNGWPGRATVTTRGVEGAEQRAELSYSESWGGVLGPHRQWRCYVCPDHTGEFADVAVGDPWYIEPDGADPGRSLIVARTERGRRAIRAAVVAGALVAFPVANDRLPASQPELLRVRGAVWGRVAAMRLFGIPAPRFGGLPVFSIWLRELSWREKLRSTVGLARRIRRKGLWRRHPVRELDPRTLTSTAG